jgi:hypothetical protein
VLLRQNPHNVHEWHKRAKLFKDQDNPTKVPSTHCHAHTFLYFICPACLLFLTSVRGLKPVG